MKAIFGLGNPGKQYQFTRHNFGFLVLDALAKHWGVTFKKYPSLNAEVAEAIARSPQEAKENGPREKEEVVWLIKPHTFMNHSGHCVTQFLKESGLSPLHFLVVTDDAHLPFKALRYRDKGSSGGHNGLKSIEEQMHTQEYARLRCGIGGPQNESGEPEKYLKEFVLAEFTAEEKNSLESIIQSAAGACRMWVWKPLEVSAWLAKRNQETREQTDLA